MELLRAHFMGKPIISAHFMGREIRLENFDVRGRVSSGAGIENFSKGNETNALPNRASGAAADKIQAIL